MYHFLKDFFFDKKFYYFILFITKLRLIIHSIVLPHYYGLLIAKLKKNNIDDIKYLFMYLVGFWILAQFFSTIQGLVNSYLNPQFFGYVRTNIVTKIINNFKNNYKDLEMGRLITKIITAPYILFDTLSKISSFFTDKLLNLISTFGYLFYYDKFIGLSFLGIILLIILVTYIYVNTCKKLVYESEKKYDNLHEYIEDTISNLLSIYSNNKIKDELKDYNKKNKANETLETEIELCNVKFRSVYCILFIIYFIVINYLTIYLFNIGNIQLSVLISIIIINYGSLSDLLYIFYNIKSIIDSMGRVDVFTEYIDFINNNSNDNSNNNSNNKKNKTKNTFKNDFVNIKIENLYYNIENTSILKNINLNIKKKEKIILTGSIGSGKSTLCKLIFGLISNYKGDIYFNGINKKELDSDLLKKYVTYIPQHPKLFNRTLYENLTYGLDNIKINDIYEILEELELYEIKKKYINIMYELTGKNGNNLSGGQRQIVWLLRAILKDNKMIILDEPTSSLDNDTKFKVMKLIKKLSEKKNIIIISHDEELFKFMDRIIVIKKGVIIKNEIINNNKKN